MDKRSVSSWRYQASGGVTAVCVSIKHNLIVAATLNKDVIALDAEGKLLWQQPVGNQAWRIGISDDAQQVIVGTGSTRPWDMANRGLYCFDANGKQRWAVNLKSSVWGLSVSSAGNSIVAGTEGKHIVVLDQNGRRLLERTLKGWGWYASVWSTAVSADGNLLVAGSADKYFRLISRQGDLIAEYKTKASVHAAAVSADGSTVAAGDTKGNIYMTSATGDLLWTYSIRDAIWRVELSHVGQYLLVGADKKEGHLLLFDRGGGIIWRRYMGSQVTSTAISADGNVIMAGTRSGSIHIFNRAGDVLHKAQAQTNIRDVALSTNGDIAIAGSEDKYIYAFRLATTQKDSTMTIIDDNRLSEPLPAHLKKVFETMFTAYGKVVVKREFSEGFSGSRVFLVRPIPENGRPELLSVVKTDERDRIEKEWQAYTTCIKNRLPRVADISGDPVYPHGSQYGGLRYPMAGDGVFDVTSLQAHCQQAPIDDVLYTLDRLFKNLGMLWEQKDVHVELHLSTAYDSSLPPNLLLEWMDSVKTADHDLRPETIRQQAAPFKIGDTVHLSHFQVTRIWKEDKKLELNIPSNLLGSYLLRCQSVSDISTYKIGQIIHQPLTCRVKQTRSGALQELAAQALGKNVDLTAETFSSPNRNPLPNPLLALPNLLNQSFDAHTACIHADLHLGNVLVESKSGNVHLIDFVNAGEFHILRDFLNLELATVTRVLPADLSDPQQIIPLYEKLHCAMHHVEEVEPPVGLERPFAILLAIRQSAQDYFFKRNEWREYYSGLIIYLLGSLRYGDLDRIAGSKQIAFWGATAVLNLLENEVACTDKRRTPSNKKEEMQSKQGTTTVYGDVVQGDKIEGDKVGGDKIVISQDSKATAQASHDQTQTMFYGAVNGPIHTGSGDINITHSSQTEKNTSRKRSRSGISADLYSQIRTTLLDCAPFATDRELKATFVDNKLRPWRYRLPQADNHLSRIDMLIDFLHNQHNAAQENALVLLLRVLSERLDIGDACHHHFANAADALERERKAS